MFHLIIQALLLRRERVEDDRGPVAIAIAHPYSQIVMKLLALRDLQDDDAKQRGQHGAYDISRCVAMMTTEEWEQGLEIRGKYRDDAAIIEARQITGE